HPLQNYKPEWFSHFFFPAVLPAGSVEKIPPLSDRLKKNNAGAFFWEKIATDTSKFFFQTNHFDIVFSSFRVFYFFIFFDGPKLRLITSLAFFGGIFSKNFLGASTATFLKF